jgi:hypothetical protein
MDEAVVNEEGGSHVVGRRRLAAGETARLRLVEPLEGERGACWSGERAGPRPT